MYKNFITSAILFSTMFFTPQFVEAVPAKDGQLIRAGISNSNFKEYYFNTTTISATDKFSITDKSTGTLIGDFDANENIKINIENNLFTISQDTTQIATGVVGPIVVASNDGFVTISGLKRAGKPAYYRGTFEITKAPSKNNQFNVINVVDLESYLRGVVPNEMPVKFGHEALKAQSVLARNYVLKPKEKRYHNFDVCDSVACQVYYGANTEKPESDIAIQETENIVALYDGELILALYSSTSGGYTENYENAFSTDSATGYRLFPGIPLPYMKGVPDNPKTCSLENEEAMRKFYTSTPDTFDNQSPYFRWTKEWTVEELETVLKKTLKTQANTGFVKPRFPNYDDMGHLKEINITKRGVSGKAMTVEIITDKFVYRVQKELPIRRVFQKNNISLPSANVFFEIKDEKIDKTQDTIKKVYAHGGGFGHGVGMSQWGAGEMGKQGYSYDEIIKHYFQNVSVGTYPIVLSYQNGVTTAVQDFYTTRKKAYLVLDNKFQNTTFTVVINSQELRIDAVPSLFKPEKIDISAFLLKGQNRITYVLPSTEVNKRPIKLYVELSDPENIKEEKEEDSNKWHKQKPKDIIEPEWQTEQKN